MLNQIKGLHHVTALAGSARENNAFFTQVLGLRRVKKAVNFDAPDVYHLYYGDERGTPGSVMTYFPFPNARSGKRGTGEVSVTRFAIPKGSADHWAERLATFQVERPERAQIFGAETLLFDGPDGERLALVEAEDDRAPWTAGGVAEDMAIRGFHSVEIALTDAAGQAELLRFMGYEEVDRTADRIRYAVAGGNPANVVDLWIAPGLGPAKQSAGSVHHVAFAVANRARQLEVHEALTDAGIQVTPPINRDYFWAIYFRTPGGVLFEVATNEPGFDRDEDPAHLGECLKLPAQHEHLRHQLERQLEPID